MRDALDFEKSTRLKKTREILATHSLSIAAGHFSFVLGETRRATQSSCLKQATSAQHRTT
ncbi:MULTISPECIES: hypothetical protein [Burkholderiaceae]|uniref:hypothetical protein n=1 Tax=Burkholderiaceae TaxID=119060 RepID=UPI001115ABEC|nr:MULTISPECIES: hypothetical protein [Burkholderiaceae]MCF2134025.1 hypothetical protein [Mycetohabitans sp. B3]MCG1039579.1 hypothetical protein [Mycetohabitans sp. B7]